MLDDIPVREACPVRNKCIELTKKYSGNELQVVLAEVTADEWLDMYGYKPFTMPKPKVALEYLGMTSAQKLMFDKQHPTWAESEEMQKYGERKRESVSQMASNQSYLEETAKYLEGDKPRRDKVLSVLAEYPTAEVRMAKPSVSWHDPSVKSR